MNKTRFDERLENALNAFFETRPEPHGFELAYAERHADLSAAETTFSERADKWLGIARQLLLFGPGTFMLFNMTLAVAFFFPTVGISPQGCFMFLSAFFMSYAGAGSLKNFKNAAVPLSTVGMALAVVISSLLIFGRQTSDLYFWHSIYLFPVVLIVARAIQSMVAASEDRDER